MNIPILTAFGEIVGYTNGRSLRHPYAERLLGNIVKAAYVEITDEAELAGAGAPPNWSGEWRCLALCSANMPAQGRVAVMQTTQHCPPDRRARSQFDFFTDVSAAWKGGIKDGKGVISTHRVIPMDSAAASSGGAYRRIVERRPTGRCPSLGG